MAGQYYMAGLGRVGYINIGNVCYMSSVLQCLSHVDPLRHYLMTEPIEDQINWGTAPKGLLAFFYTLNVRQQWSSKFSSIRFVSLKSVLGKLNREFASTIQCDAEELLNFLMNHLQSDLKRPSNFDLTLGPLDQDNVHSLASVAWLVWNAENSSVITDLFYFQMGTRTTCSYCGALRYNWDQSYTIQLALKKSSLSSFWRKHPLQTLLDEYFSETVPDAETTCDLCEVRRLSPQLIRVWSLPKILILQLKRFEAKLDPVTGVTYSKITTNVDFPIEGLDMTNYTHPENPQAISKVYDLFGVVNHDGPFGEGHYYSYVRTSDGAEPQGWRKFNDYNVSDISDREVVTKNAYILFYKRREQIPRTETQV